MVRRHLHPAALSVYLLTALLLLGARVAAPGAEWSWPFSGGDKSSREAAAASHRPWIWTVEGGRAKVWIIGCMHLGVSSDRSTFQPYYGVYQQAEDIYFEVRPGGWESDAARSMMGRNGYYPAGRSLQNEVSPETWRQLEKALRGDGGRLRNYSRMQPWMAAFTFYQDQYEKMGLQRSHGLESVIEQMALRDRKPVGGMETPTDQVMAMACASVSDQEEFLKGAISNPEATEAQTRALRQAWLAGDDGRMRLALGQGDNWQPSVMDQRIIDDRNQRWLKVFRAIDQRGRPAAVFVGVEHLITKSRSLPSILQGAGYSVRRVPAKSATPDGSPVTLLQPFLTEKKVD